MSFKILGLPVASFAPLFGLPDRELAAQGVVRRIVDADVVTGEDAAPVINCYFDNPRVDYLHVHNAKPGCFAARVVRA